MNYKFREKIKSFQVDELKKRLPFVSEISVDYDIEYENGYATGININLEDPAPIDYLMEEIYPLKEIPSKVAWEKTGDVATYRSDQDILQMEGITVISNGQLLLTGNALKLYRSIDDVLRRISVDLFRCSEFMFPVLLSYKTLEKAGYFEHNPHQWLHVRRVKKCVENYPQNRNGKPLQTIDFGYELPPTMCYYIYDMLEGTQVPDSSYTTVGRSFRYEGINKGTIDRLFDFTIRETVFIGSREYVEVSIKSYMNAVFSFMESLGLAGACETASDVFYLTDMSAKRINVQKMMDSKYELLLHTAEGSRVAAASFNRHGQYISKRFRLMSLEDENSFLYSACAGIGLERLLRAYLAQKGMAEECLSKYQVDDVLSQIAADMETHSNLNA